MKKTYKKFNPVKAVATFHQFTRNGILDKPAFPEKKRTDLRVLLIREELEELEEAIHQKDLIEVADALTDILYVTIGSFLEFGLGKIVPKLFKEVQRSNMTKFCKNEDEAKLQVEVYKTRNLDAGYYPVDDYFILYNKATGKTIKNRDYSQPDLAKIIKKAQR